MIHSESAIRFDRGCQTSGAGDSLATRVLIGVVQFLLAIVCAPVVVILLVGVGLYMVVEWGYLRMDVATRRRPGDFRAIPPLRARLPGVTIVR